MGHPAAGLSFKLRSPVTGLMQEVSNWLHNLEPDVSTAEIEAGTFQPNTTVPIEEVHYGAVTRGYTLSVRWSSPAEIFFNALQGEQNVPYEHGPTGDTAGKIMITGACNVGGWQGPGGAYTGSIESSISLKVKSRLVSTIPASAPATVAITSSSVADPTVITATAAHLLTSGDVIVIAGHTGATPDINGAHAVTVLTATTFSIPEAVTVGGTGGTIQD